MFKFVALCALVGYGVSAAIGPGSPDCPPNVPLQMKVPDPNDCTLYSTCGPFFSAKQSCPMGLHFNAVTGKCTSPFEAGCDPAYQKPVVGPPAGPAAVPGSAPAASPPFAGAPFMNIPSGVGGEASAPAAVEADDSA